MVRTQEGLIEIQGNLLEMEADMTIILNRFRIICAEAGIDADRELERIIEISKMSEEEVIEKLRVML